jgi:DNA-binding protein Fis
LGLAAVWKLSYQTVHTSRIENRRFGGHSQAFISGSAAAQQLPEFQLHQGRGTARAASSAYDITVMRHIVAELPVGYVPGVVNAVSELNQPPGRARAPARLLLSSEAVTAAPSPLRNQLTRAFAQKVAEAVEAAIASRARALVQKNERISRSGHSNAAGRQRPIDEPWPTLEEHQWAYIYRVLARTHGNKSEAAAMLGLHRRSLQRLLRRKGTANKVGGRERAKSSGAATPKSLVTGDGTIVLESLTFSEIERAILAWALRRHQGSGRQAARSLGLARSTFADKANRYALKAPSAPKGRAASR